MPDDNPNREAAKWRTKFREAEARIKELEEAAGDDGEVDDDGNPIRDVEKHALSREAASWRKKFRAAESRIQELEDANGSHDDGASRIESAFWRELATGERRIEDHESAWDLFTARGFADLVKVSDEGDVTGMDSALEKLIDRYPWLADEISPNGNVDIPFRRTAPPPKKKKDGESSYSREQLQRRMPALRKHRGDRRVEGGPPS